MKNLKIKKTLNFHKYCIGVNGFEFDWKLILVMISTISGIIIGSLTAKGEGSLYLNVVEVINNYLVDNEFETTYSVFIVYLLIPTVFAMILFFSGMSLIGVPTACIIPFTFSLSGSIVIYYMFDAFALKGLAYIVIMLLPYLIVSLLSLMLLSIETIKMSQYLIRTISKTKRNSDYNFTLYYKNYLKSYALIIIACIIKITIDKLFVGLFTF